MSKQRSPISEGFYDLFGDTVGVRPFAGTEFGGDGFGTNDSDRPGVGSDAVGLLSGVVVVLPGLGEQASCNLWSGRGGEGRVCGVCKVRGVGPGGNSCYLLPRAKNTDNSPTISNNEENKNRVYSSSQKNDDDGDDNNNNNNHQPSTRQH